VKRVYTRFTLIGIPKGTTGIVQRVEQTTDGCAVIVQWDVPLAPNRARWPHEDRFNKDMYATYLLEIEE
jgi:hypothetical protein